MESVEPLEKIGAGDEKKQCWRREQSSYNDDDAEYVFFVAKQRIEHN